MPYTPPPRPLMTPELLRRASERLVELAERAQQLADAGTSCFNDAKVEHAATLARQILNGPPGR